MVGRSAVIVVTALLAAASSLAAQQSGAGAAPPRDVSRAAVRVTGRVTDQDTGAPLAGVEVMLGPVGSRTPSRSALTNLDGRYEIDALTPGDYQFHAEKTGFIADSRRISVRNPSESAPAAGSRPFAETVDVRLSRPAVIAGTITDENGAPLPNVVPQLLRKEWSRGRWKMSNVLGMNVTQTDDRGEFRLHDLPPGRYYLMAQPPAAAVAGTPMQRARQASQYAPTYYPGTTDIASAAPLTLVPGQTMRVTLVLDPTRCPTVSGTVIGRDGAPMAGAQMFMRPLQSAVSRPVVVDMGGRFTVPMVAPGKYMLQASLAARGEVPEISVATIVVGREDLSSVIVTPVRPARGKGRLTGDPKVLETFAAAGGRVVAQLEERVIAGRALQATLKDDLTFEFLTWPGHALVGVTGAPSNFAVRAVRAGGVDVTHRGIDFADGQEISGLEVELTNRVAEVSGTVKSPDGAIVADCSVVVFARWPNDWFAISARSNLDGHFLIRPLSPGEYLAVALPVRQTDEPGWWTDPALLDSLRGRAVRFSVAEGEAKTLSLVLLAEK